MNTFQFMIYKKGERTKRNNKVGCEEKVVKNSHFITNLLL